MRGPAQRKHGPGGERAMTKKYEDATGESGWVSAEEEEGKAKPVLEEGKVERTAEEKLAVSADEKLAKEAEEVRGKEKVRDKLARLVRELRSGTVFGAAKKALWGELEEMVGRLKGEETVGEMEKAAKLEEEKQLKKAV